MWLILYLYFSYWENQFPSVFKLFISTHPNYSLTLQSYKPKLISCTVFMCLLPGIQNDWSFIHLPGMTWMKELHLSLCILDSHPCRKTLASVKWYYLSCKIHYFLRMGTPGWGAGRMTFWGRDFRFRCRFMHCL